MDVKPLLSETRASLNAAENAFDTNALGVCKGHLRDVQKDLNNFFADEAPAEPEKPAEPVPD